MGGVFDPFLGPSGPQACCLGLCQVSMPILPPMHAGASPRKRPRFRDRPCRRRCQGTSAEAQCLRSAHPLAPGVPFTRRRPLARVPGQLAACDAPSSSSGRSTPSQGGLAVPLHRPLGAVSSGPRARQAPKDPMRRCRQQDCRYRRRAMHPVAADAAAALQGWWLQRWFLWPSL